MTTTTVTPERPKRRIRRPRPLMSVTPVASEPTTPPVSVAAFRRPDDTVCHGRCGRPLSLQGVRGLLEADFYCYVCLSHVTIPLGVLRAMPVATAW